MPSSNDLAIIVDTKRFIVDRQEIKKKSKYFNALITHEESSNPDIEQIVLTEVNEQAVEYIINFLKTDEAKISNKNVTNVYFWGDYFSEEKLIIKCREFLINKLLNPRKPSNDYFQSAVAIARTLVDENLCDVLCETIGRDALSMKPYIEQLGFNIFSRAIKKCQICLREGEKFYMGKCYYDKLFKFLSSCFPDDIEEISNILNKFPKKYGKQNNYIVPWALQENERTFSRNGLVKKQRPVINHRFTSCGSHDPSSWTIHGMKIYFQKLYGRKYRGRKSRPIAGIDVIYRNIWTDEKQVSACNLLELSEKYSCASFELNPNETIRRVEILGDYRIDCLTFVTSEKRTIGPFGRSIRPKTMTNVIVVNPPLYRNGTYPIKLDSTKSYVPSIDEYLRVRLTDFNVTVSKNENLQSEDELEDDSSQKVVRMSLPVMQNEIKVLESNSENMAGLALHGFNYNLSIYRGIVCWVNVNLVFCGIPNDLVVRNNDVAMENCSLVI